MSGSKFYHFTATGLFYSVPTAGDAITALNEAGFIWLNYFKPEKRELTSLIDSMGIHPLSVEDCLDNSQVPKIEHFSDNSFILFNSYMYQNKTLFIDEVDLFIGKNYLITVSGISSGERNPLAGLENRINNEMNIAKAGPGFLMHLILDYVVDDKFKAVEALEDELEEAEDNVLANPETFEPTDLMRLRKNLVSLRKSLFHEREILVKICRKDCPFIPEKTIIQYRDVYDHLTKFLELTETYREIVTSLMELYTSLLNNLMARASNETNASVRRLTLIATIFMPLTLLASIGGMSEWTMMTGAENWRIAYPLFIMGMIVIGIGAFLLIRKLEKSGWKRGALNQDRTP
jgi:magnesium transporter